MGDFIASILTIVLGATVLLLHRHLAAFPHGIAVHTKNRIARRCPPWFAAWYVVGPFWLYRVPFLLIGSGLVAIGVAALIEVVR